MENYNLDKYFDSNEDKYYDSKILTKILEDITGKSFKQILSDVNSSKISVTEEQIVEYLNNEFEKNDFELKQRIEKRNSEREKRKNDSSQNNFDYENLKRLNEEDAAQEFADNLSASRYSFTPYTLKYYRKYTLILSNKLITLLGIVEKISLKRGEEIEEQLYDLDIILDGEGNISKSDIIRLIVPTIYNFNKLNEKIEKANDLSTYLTKKLTEQLLYKRGMSDESELYPSRAIQIKTLHGYDEVGTIPLTEYQKNEMNESYAKRMKKTADILINW